jgi:hypothetical protein
VVVSPTFSAKDLYFRSHSSFTLEMRSWSVRGAEMGEIVQDDGGDGVGFGVVSGTCGCGAAEADELLS